MIVVTRCASGSANNRCRTCGCPRWCRLKWSVSSTHKRLGTVSLFTNTAQFRLVVVPRRVVGKSPRHRFPWINGICRLRFPNLHAKHFATRQTFGHGCLRFADRFILCFACAYAIGPTKRPRDVTIIRLLLNKDLVIHFTPPWNFWRNDYTKRGPQASPLFAFSFRLKTFT